MPVKSAMKMPIGIESTPSRRACWLASGSHVRTSAAARTVSPTNAASSPTRSTRVRVARPTSSTAAVAFMVVLLVDRDGDLLPLRPGLLALGEREGQDAVLELRGDLLRVDVTRQREGALEGSITAFPDVILRVRL